MPVLVVVPTYTPARKTSIVPLPEGQTVQLILITGDDTLADSFVEDLEQRDTDNPVLRVHSFHEGIEKLSGETQDEMPQIVILDMRDAVREGTRFLNEVHNRRPFGEPVIFIIGAGESEEEILQGHARYVAGQLPAIGAGAAFVEQVTSMLSSSWSFERKRDS